MEMICKICIQNAQHIHLYNKWKYDIVQCTSCKSGMTIIPENFLPNEIYDETYFQGGQKDGYSNYKGSENVLKKEFTKVLKRIKHYKSKGKLLEVGSAYGFFLNQAKTQFDITGIEVSKNASEFANAHGNVTYNSIVNEEIVRKIGKIDVLIMLDVIEHLSRPDEDFKLLSGILNKGGLVYITTGDFSSLYARLSKKNWRLMTPPQHLFFYSKKGIIEFLKQYGIAVKEIKYVWKLVPLGLIFFQLLSKIGLKPLFAKYLNFISIPINLFDTMTVIGFKK